MQAGRGIAGSVMALFLLGLVGCGSGEGNLTHQTYQGVSAGSDLSALIDQNKRGGIFLTPVIADAAEEGEDLYTFLFCADVTFRDLNKWEKCHPVFYDEEKNPVYLNNVNLYVAHLSERKQLIAALMQYNEDNLSARREELVTSRARGIRDGFAGIAYMVVGAALAVVRKVGLNLAKSEVVMSVPVGRFMSDQSFGARAVRMLLRRSRILHGAALFFVGSGVWVLVNAHAKDAVVYRQYAHFANEHSRFRRHALTSDEEVIGLLKAEIFDVNIGQDVHTVANVRRTVRALARYLMGVGSVPNIAYICVNAVGITGSCSQL